MFVRLLEQLGGHGDSAVARQTAGKLARETGSWDHILFGFLAGEEGRREDLEREIQALESAGEAGESAEDSLFRAAGAEALRGVEASLRGDREAAIRSLEAALPHFWGPLAFLLRYELGELWLEQGGFAEAERYLESVEMREPRNWSAPVEFYLGKVYEGLGKLDEARLHYGRFVSWWQDCDPELRPLWEEGRQALERLERLKPL
jgi:tetratricopeptide (TPR) repeat protein